MQLAKRRDIFEGIVAATNIKLQKTLPDLKGQRTQLGRELAKVKSQADQLLGDWSNLETEANKTFLKDKLNDLAKRRSELESALDKVESAIGEIERESVSREMVQATLNEAMRAFERASPYRQKQLIGLTLASAVVSCNRIRLALRGRPPELPAAEPEIKMAQSVERSAPSHWLPGLHSQTKTCSI